MENETVETTIVNDESGNPTALVVELPETETESDDEVIEESEWRESFSRMQETLGQLATAMDRATKVIAEMGQQIIGLQNRLPENLTVLISTQQETISNLVTQAMQTVQTSLLTQQPRPGAPENQEPSESTPVETVPEIDQSKQTPRRRKI